MMRATTVKRSVRLRRVKKKGRTWNRLGVMGGAGGKTSASSTSLRMLNTFSLGAPTSGWVSRIFGSSSEMATRTGSSGRLVLKQRTVVSWLHECGRMMGRDVPLLPAGNPFLRGDIPIRPHSRCRNLHQFFFFFIVFHSFFLTAATTATAAAGVGVGSGEGGG